MLLNPKQKIIIILIFIITFSNLSAQVNISTGSNYHYLEGIDGVDLFPSVEAPVVEGYGEELLDEVIHFTNSTDVTLKNLESTGDIYYTLDGSDPREIGGTVVDQAVGQILHKRRMIWLAGVHPRKKSPRDAVFAHQRQGGANQVQNNGIIGLYSTGFP